MTKKSKRNKTAVSPKKAARAAQKARARRMTMLRYGGIGLIVVVAFVGLALFRNAGRVPAEELAALTGPNLDGRADAAVQLIEYGDLACSACRAWHNAGIKEQLKEQFGDQVSFEFRHFPVITANSPRGAAAAQCAAEQDAFWAYHDYVYENLETYPNFTSSRVKEIAAAVGLDQGAFDACVDSGRYRDFVTDAIRQAQADGARGTPTFLINGRQVSPSFQAMSAAIEDELN